MLSRGLVLAAVGTGVVVIVVAGCVVLVVLLVAVSMRGQHAHVFEEFDPTQRIDAAERIRHAREELRRRARQPTLFDVT
ncbi:MAG: hypothetical protein ACR2LK_14885 [Solirubrobacteraceae bacterium]